MKNPLNIKIQHSQLSKTFVRTSQNNTEEGLRFCVLQNSFIWHNIKWINKWGRTGVFKNEIWWSSHEVRSLSLVLRQSFYFFAYLLVSDFVVSAECFEWLLSHTLKKQNISSSFISYHSWYIKLFQHCCCKDQRFGFLWKNIILNVFPPNVSWYYCSWIII